MLAIAGLAVCLSGVAATDAEAGLFEKLKAMCCKKKCCPPPTCCEPAPEPCGCEAPAPTDCGCGAAPATGEVIISERVIESSPADAPTPAPEPPSMDDEAPAAPDVEAPGAPDVEAPSAPSVEVEVEA